MTNSISPNTSSIPQGAEPRPAPVKATPAPPPASASNNATPGEAVTLSAAAQASTQLLNAARDASGVNQAAVDKIRTALQGGSYNVAPQDLAQAIATVLKELK